MPAKNIKTGSKIKINNFLAEVFLSFSFILVFISYLNYTTLLNYQAIEIKYINQIKVISYNKLI